MTKRQQQLREAVFDDIDEYIYDFIEDIELDANLGVLLSQNIVNINEITNRMESGLRRYIKQKYGIL